MTNAKKAVLDRLGEKAKRCKERTGKLDAKTFKSYMGIGGFSFLDGLVSYDSKGIRYEDFERNGNIKFDLTYGEVADYAENHYHEQLSLLEAE